MDPRHKHQRTPLPHTHTHGTPTDHWRTPQWSPRWSPWQPPGQTPDGLQWTLERLQWPSESWWTPDRPLTDSWRTPEGLLIDSRRTPDGLLADTWRIPDRLQEIYFKVLIWRAVPMSSPNLESCSNELSKFCVHLDPTDPPTDPEGPWNLKMVSQIGLSK